MQSFEEYMKNLKQWLQDTADSQLEEMSDFFTKKLHGYEEHMAIWEKSYRIFAEVLPLECQKILDLGCGTGLALDKESLHHFLPERKEELYRKIYCSLKQGGIFILGDYIACCNEEEELLRGVHLNKRKQSAIPENCYVHFDIPLTLEHEKELLQNAGFVIEKVLDGSATIIIAGKGSDQTSSCTSSKVMVI